VASVSVTNYSSFSLAFPAPCPLQGAYSVLENHLPSPSCMSTFVQLAEYFE
jgi:hypothetical protein